MSISSAVMRVQPARLVGEGAESLNLAPGQRLHGVVLRNQSGVTDLLLHGQVVRAQTELSLVPGAKLDLHVRNVAGEVVTLGVLPSDGGTSAARGVTQADLADLAVALRLPVNERTFTVLRELMTNGASLTTESARQVLAAARAFDPQGTLPLRPLVWLVAQGLPVTPESLALATAALSDGAPLPSPLAPGALPAARLAAAARTTDAVLADALPDLPGGARAPVVAVRVVLARGGLAGPPPASLSLTADGLARQLTSIASSVATPLEARVARLLRTADGQGAAAPASLDHPASRPAARQPDHTRPASIEAGAGSQPSSSVGGLPQFPDLRLLIHRSLSAIQGPSGATTSQVSALSPGQAAAADALHQLANTVEFAQVANAARADGGDGRQTVWLPLPLPPGPDGRLPTLSVTRWQEGEGAEPVQRLRAAVNLSLEALGDLTIHLDLHGSHLRCDIQAAPPSVDTLRPHLQDLAERLAALGYTVEAVSTVAEPLPAPVVAPPPPRRIDQRA